MSYTRLINQTETIKNSFFRLPALRELAGIIPILFIIGIGYRPLLIVALIILGLATAGRSITSHQRPIFDDHVSVVLFLSLISLIWVLVLEFHTLARNIVAGVIITAVFCLLGRGIHLLKHQTRDSTGPNTSTSDILHWSLLTSIAITALGWSSLFYYSLALVLVVVTQRLVKGGFNNALSVSLVALGLIVSWSVRRNNEGQFWLSFDQLFRSSVAEGLPQWGRHDFVAATGTSFSYHWLGEATSGVIARFAGFSAVDGVTKVLPTLAIVFSLSALVQLGNRLSFSRQEVLAGSLLTIFLCHEFQIYSIGSLWGFVMFLIGLDSLERFRRETSGALRTRLLLPIALIGITVVLTLTQSTLGLYFLVLTGVLLGTVMLKTSQLRPDFLAVVTFQSVVIYWLRITLLAGAEGNVWQPSVSIRNVLQFRGLDLYFGDQWIIVVVTSLLFLLTVSQMMTGFGLTTWRQFRSHEIFLAFVASVVSSLLLANFFSIGGPDAQQARFLSPLVVFGTFISLLFFIHAVVNHPFQNTDGIKLAETVAAALVTIGLLLYIKDAIYVQKLSLQRSVGVALFVAGLQMILLGLLLLRRRIVDKLRLHFFVTLLIGGLIFVGHSRVLLKITNALPRSIDRQREEVFTGTTETQECLKFVRDETPRVAIVASNWLRIPHPSLQEKYFLVTAWTQRRAYIDGPIYVSNPRTKIIEERVATSYEFAESATELAFNALQQANVSFFIVDKKQTTITSWEPYATPMFERSSCLILQLRPLAE
jgi:hypothetical protein